MKLLVIYGPTVTGKTDLAIEFAQKYNGELISADSRQVYKSLDIGTGKVSLSSNVEKHQNYWLVDGVKIHGFDLVSPGGNFSVADFINFASKITKIISSKKKLPIIVGGTGFYIKSYLQGINSFGIPKNKFLRKELNNFSISNLQERLSQLNTSRLIKMNESDRNNPRRLIRAIEIASSIRKPTKSNVQPTYLLVGVTAPNSYLYNRADKWLETRLAQGMVDEVKNLRKIVPDNWLENLGLEYRWIIRLLKKEISQTKAKVRLKGDIHSLIRRQKTFFNQFPAIDKIDISGENWHKELEKTVRTWYNQKNG